MVLIISSEDDQSTNDVIDWLLYFKIKFIRVSHLNKLCYSSVIINNEELNVDFTINGSSHKLSDFKAFWYRRSFLNMSLKSFNGNSNLHNEIKRHLENEAQEIHRIAKRYIEKNSINKHNDIFINKLEVLKLAADIGLEVPNTLVTDNKNDLLSFFKKHKSIITKNFSQGIFINYGSKILGNSTKIVDEKMLESIPDNFHYMLFQEMAEKIIELRVFFLDNKFYSSAIFSQNDEKTKIDFRNYNFEKPNRTPPFLLPKEIEKKLKLLIKKMNINSGSIDILVTKNSEYLFLEVNPIGQFSQVSIPCNYYIEKKIAEQLKKRAYGII